MTSPSPHHSLESLVADLSIKCLPHPGCQVWSWRTCCSWMCHACSGAGVVGDKLCVCLVIFANAALSSRDPTIPTVFP